MNLAGTSTIGKLSLGVEICLGNTEFQTKGRSSDQNIIQNLNFNSAPFYTDSYTDFYADFYADFYTDFYTDFYQKHRKNPFR